MNGLNVYFVRALKPGSAAVNTAMEGIVVAASQVLPLVGVLLGSGATYVVTSLNERKRVQRDEAREWRVKKADSYLAFMNAVKQMRLISAQMAASLNLDEEADPIDLSEGVRKLVQADDDRGTACEAVYLYGDESPVLKARQLNKAVWGLEWIARERHPDATPDLWIERCRVYASAIDDFIDAIRLDLGVPGRYSHRTVEYPHAEEQRKRNAM